MSDQPSTEAGRRLIASLPTDEATLRSPEYVRHVARAIRAIEKAALLDVERLARAIHASHDHPNLPGCLEMDRQSAGAICVALASLRETPPEPDLRALDVERSDDGYFVRDLHLFGLTVEELRVAVATADLYYPQWRARPPSRERSRQPDSPEARSE